MSRLTHALDKDVLAIVQKFLDDESSPLPSISDVINHILRSNSSLKRRNRKQLESSIERVIGVLREDRETSDSEANVEGNPTAGVSMAETALQESRLMNKSLMKAWKVDSAGSSASAALSTSATLRPTTPKRDLYSTGAATAGKKSSMGSEHQSKRARTEPPVAQYDSLAKLGGINDIVDQLRKLIALPMLRPDFCASQVLRPPKGILLHGPPGCGKTAVVNAFASALGVSFIPVSAPSIIAGMSGESEKALRELFLQAKNAAPAILFIDEIDAITPKRDSAQRQMEMRIVAQLLTCMDDLALEKTGGKVVIVMAATNRPDSLDSALRRGGRFDKEIAMPIPDPTARRRILETLTADIPLGSDVDIASLATRTAGFVGADLKNLVDRSLDVACERLWDLITGGANEDTDAPMPDAQGDGPLISNGAAADRKGMPTPNSFIAQLQQDFESVRSTTQTAADVVLTQSDFDATLPTIVPSLKREGFEPVPATSWKDVGALEHVRTKLQELVVQAVKEPELLKSYGLTPSAGILLWGPPGCGKTLLAKAVANESSANFISVKVPELINKYVGESEKAVHLLFQRARSTLPCVIFFDELDALAPRRDGDITESSTRVVNTMLTELDAVSRVEGLFVIGTTNRPRDIDPALIRPGRLGNLLFVGLPSARDRVEILRTQCARANMNFSDEIARVAESCDRFTGADLDALRHEAAWAAILQSRPVEVADWLKAAREVGPSVSEEQERLFARLVASFGKKKV